MMTGAEKATFSEDARRANLTMGPPDADPADRVLFDGQAGGGSEDLLEGDDLLDAVMNVRLKRSEKAKLREVARQAGLTISAWARRRCLGHKVAVNVNEAVIDHVRQAGLEAQRLDRESGGVYRERLRAIQHELIQALHLLNPPHREGSSSAGDHDRQKGPQPL